MWNITLITSCFLSPPHQSKFHVLSTLPESGSSSTSMEEEIRFFEVCGCLIDQRNDRKGKRIKISSRHQRQNCSQNTNQSRRKWKQDKVGSQDQSKQVKTITKYPQHLHSSQTTHSHKPRHHKVRRKRKRSPSQKETCQKEKNTWNRWKWRIITLRAAKPRHLSTRKI